MFLGQGLLVDDWWSETTPAPTSTAGSPEGLNTFWRHWATLKGSLRKLGALGPDLLALERRLKAIEDRTRARGQTAEELEAQQALRRVRALRVRWTPADAKLKQYLPVWQIIARATERLNPLRWFGMGTLEALPLIPIAALAALAFVVGTGLSLLKEYAQERALVDDVERRTLTPAQAMRFVRPTGGGLFETIRNLPTMVTVATGLGLVLLLVSVTGGKAR